VCVCVCVWCGVGGSLEGVVAFVCLLLCNINPIAFACVRSPSWPTCLERCFCWTKAGAHERLQVLCPSLQLVYRCTSWDPSDRTQLFLGRPGAWAACAHAVAVRGCAAVVVALHEAPPKEVRKSGRRFRVVAVAVAARGAEVAVVARVFHAVVVAGVGRLPQGGAECAMCGDAVVASLQSETVAATAVVRPLAGEDRGAADAGVAEIPSGQGPLLALGVEGSPLVEAVLLAKQAVAASLVRGHCCAAAEARVEGA
jgi:hypothetical protein